MSRSAAAGVAATCVEKAELIQLYEQLSVVGEGSYGVVLKCRHRQTGQLVAIKKFLETEEDAAVRKMALREIRMLKKLRHSHLVNMLEVFRRKRRFYLVLEYLDHTLLDELEAAAGGLGGDVARSHLFQLLRGIEFCHQNTIIHRDVKPENVLVSRSGVVKLCDFGFARALAAPGEPYTEYVATRWYRAPELLVADHRYGPEVDIWAIGCLFAEMLTGDPLFPGDSDIDQISLIVRLLGKLAPRHQQVVMKLSTTSSGSSEVQPRTAPKSLPGAGPAREVICLCLRTEPRARPSATALLRHRYFHADGFAETFSIELKKKISRQIECTPLVRAAEACEGAAATAAVARGQRARQPNSWWSLAFVPEHPEATRSSTSTAQQSENTDLSGAFGTDGKPCKKQAPHFVSQATSYAETTSETQGTESVTSASQSSLPAPRAALLAPSQKLCRTLNTTFNSFPVPIASYPRTQYIKKTSRSLLIEDSHLPLAKKKQARKQEISLPDVRGAINSPMKNSRNKPQMILHSTKVYDSWNSTASKNTAGGATGNSSLPFM